jgi:hypothetical protein
MGLEPGEIGVWRHCSLFLPALTLKQPTHEEPQYTAPECFSAIPGNHQTTSMLVNIRMNYYKL